MRRHNEISLYVISKDMVPKRLYTINDNLNMYINDHLRMYTSDYALI